MAFSVQISAKKQSFFVIKIYSRICVHFVWHDKDNLFLTEKYGRFRFSCSYLVSKCIETVERFDRSIYSDKAQKLRGIIQI